MKGCDSGFGNRLAQRLNQMGFRVYATVLSTDSTGAEQLKAKAIFEEQMIVLWAGKRKTINYIRQCS